MGRISSPTHIEEKHALSDFDCGESTLNDWLIRRALRNERGKASRTYVVCESETNVVVGYYSLATGSVDTKDAPGRVKRNMPNHIPAIVLGRLAVRIEYSGQGIGEGLLKDAVSRSISASEQVGARVLLVHVLNERAIKFYKDRGFIDSPLNENTLMLPLT